MEEFELRSGETMDLAPTRKNHSLEVQIEKGKVELVPFDERKQGSVIVLSKGEFARIFADYTIVPITKVVEFTTQHVRKKK